MSVKIDEKLEIHCKAYGTNPEIKWTIGKSLNEKKSHTLLMTEVFPYHLGGKEDFNRSHVVLSDDVNHVKNAVLTIEHVNTTDSNVYDCTARNEATGSKNYVVAKTGTNVTVTSKYILYLLQVNIFKQKSSNWY